MFFCSLPDHALSIMSRLTARVLLSSLCLAALTRLPAQEPAPSSTPADLPAATPAPAKETAPGTEPAPVVAGPDLTLEECINRVLQKNFNLRVQGFNTANAQENLVISKAGFDPTFTALGQRTHTQGVTSFNTSLGTTTSSDYRQDTTDIRVGVNQTIQTGAAVSLSASVLRSGNNVAASTLNPSYNSDVSLSVTQPLLKGAGTKVNRATIENAKLGITIANLYYKGSVLQAVRDTEAAYYTLAFARGQLAVKQRSLELAQKLYDENKVKKNTGVATDLDVLTAEVGVGTAQNGVVLAQQQVRNSEDNLLALTGQFEFSTPPGPVSFSAYLDPAPTIDEAFKHARDLQPTYVAAQSTIKQLELAVYVANNGRLPTLNADVALGFNGTDRSTNSSIENLKAGDNYNWQADLSLSVPWGLRADRARARIALNNLHQEQAQLQSIEQNLLVQVRAAVLAVSTNIESVQISAKTTELATKQYELQKAKFDAGLSTSRDVLQSQTDLETARVNELSAKVNLRIAVANLHQLDGSSIDRFHIALAD
ncbi:MAG: Outer membrane protein TolC/Outer membrane protein TolC [Verrucomicrobia bacterium]|nr:MAG: Outer membrane protein TolC/Outer membrane protein TolC [Verrucomicrobiota bacterium]